MNFGRAIEHLKSGGRVTRAGWNGKGMYLYLVRGGTFAVNREPLLSMLGAGTVCTYLDHIDIRAADGTLAPWLASQADMLAEDWDFVM